MDSEQAIYEFKVRGRLEKRWELWFEGMRILVEDDEAGTPITVLMGPIADQAALHGVLAKIRDMGVPLISVQQAVTPDPHNRADADSQRTARDSNDCLSLKHVQD